MVGKKEGWMELSGMMVPRQIMIFVFRLCLLGIILLSLWRENLTLRILLQLSRKMIKGRSPGLAKFLGKARFGHYEFNGRGRMLWKAFNLSKNGSEIFENLQKLLGVSHFPQSTIKKII